LISNKSNVSLNDHIDEEIIHHTDLNVHNINININSDVHEGLQTEKRTLANDLIS